jgi:hypothetical protein
MFPSRLPVFVILFAALQLTAIAANAADPVRDGLERAKATRTDERSKAKAALISAIDAQIKTTGAAGDLEGLKALTSQKDALVSTGVVPNLPSLKEAAGQYTLALRKADGELVAAYEAAIQSYAEAQRTADADVLRKERQDLLSGNGDDSPEAFALILDRAKADYQSSISDARKLFVQAIAARVEVATRNGDLAAVTRFKAAQSAAELDQPLPEGVNDAAVVGARVRFNNSIQSANVKLAQTYRDAVRGLTRANRIDHAVAIQAEFDSTGLNGAAAGGTRIATGGTTADNSHNLARTLPSYLVASAPFAVEKEGIRPTNKCVISTHAADYLSKDFVFDVTVAVPNDNEEITVGIGDQSHKGSLRVAIYNDGGWGRLAHLAIGEQWGKKMGKVHSGEIAVVRIERHEGPITASFGAIVNGKFVPELSQTVADPKQAMPEMSEKRAKLFFTGGARFLHVRLATGAAAKADMVADAAAGGPGIGIVKFGPGNGATAVVTPAAAANDPSKGYYKLNVARLPPGFSATGPFSAGPAGLVPVEHCKIVTTAEDYFAKDFRFDVGLDLPPRVGWLEVGIGDMTKEGSFRFSIRQDRGNKPIVSLCQGDEWGKEVGKITVGSDYVMRIEHVGQSLTFAVGQLKDGVFAADLSQTVANPQKAAKGFSDRRAKLFFGGPTTWTSLQLLTGPGATVASNIPNTPAPVVAPPTPIAPPSVAPPAVSVTQPPVAPPAVGTTTAPKVNTPAVAPPIVTPTTQNTNPAATAPAIAVNLPDVAKPPEVATPPAVAGALPAKIAVADLIAVGTLESKKPPVLKDVPGRLVFAPKAHDNFWVGANGVSIPAGASWSKTGTVWICNNFQMRPWGATFVHPYGKGHILIQIAESGVLYRDDGTWVQKRGGTALPLSPDFHGKFPLRDRRCVVRSELSPDGTYKLTIDGELVTTTKVKEGRPMEFNGIFRGPGLPDALAAGHAAVIVDHGYRFTSIAGDLSLYPAK